VRPEVSVGVWARRSALLSSRHWWVSFASRQPAGRQAWGLALGIQAWSSTPMVLVAWRGHGPRPKHLS